MKVKRHARAQAVCLKTERAQINMFFKVWSEKPLQDHNLWTCSRNSFLFISILFKHILSSSAGSNVFNELSSLLCFTELRIELSSLKSLLRWFVMAFVTVGPVVARCLSRLSQVC